MVKHKGVRNQKKERQIITKTVEKTKRINQGYI